MKVFHGPQNIGGMPGMLAKAQRDLGVEALAYCRDFGPFGFVADRVFRGDTNTDISLEAAEFFKAEGYQYDVFQFYFGESLTGPRLTDVPVLKRMGKKVFFYFCGCDVRDPDATVARYPISACHECKPRQCSKNADLGRRVASEYADGIFVSTPDLLEFVPRSILLLQPVNVAALAALRKDATDSPRRNTIRVAHAPSNRTIKGTKYIIATIAALRRKGYPIELQLVEGMSHPEAMRVCSQADLAIDQVLVGSYGQFAAEMMALGKPVLCYLRPDLRNNYPPGLPIISADPEDLGQVLEEWLAQRRRLREVGEQGIEYATRVHDSRVIAQTMIDHYRKQPDDGVAIRHSSAAVETVYASCDGVC